LTRSLITDENRNILIWGFIHRGMIKEWSNSKPAIIIVLIVLSLEIICAVFLWQEFEKQQSKPLLDVKMYDWGFDKADPTKLLFDFWIVNYGNQEAKAVKVNCKLFDAAGNPQFSASENYGNVASLDYELKEFLPSKSATLDLRVAYSPICYVESCGNCEILYKRIPKLVQTFEG